MRLADLVVVLWLAAALDALVSFERTGLVAEQARPETWRGSPPAPKDDGYTWEMRLSDRAEKCASLPPGAIMWIAEEMNLATGDWPSACDDAIVFRAHDRTDL